MSEVHFLGPEWEVAFFADGNVEVEVFNPPGGVLRHAEAGVCLQTAGRGRTKSRRDAGSATAPHQFSRVAFTATWGTALLVLRIVPLLSGTLYGPDVTSRMPHGSEQMVPCQ